MRHTSDIVKRRVLKKTPEVYSAYALTTWLFLRTLSPIGRSSHDQVIVVKQKLRGWNSRESWLACVLGYWGSVWKTGLQVSLTSTDDHWNEGGRFLVVICGSMNRRRHALWWLETRVVVSNWAIACDKGVTCSNSSSVSRSLTSRWTVGRMGEASNSLTLS